MDSGIRTLAEQDINALSAVQNTQLGATGVTANGNKYRYVKFGGTVTIAPGLVVVAPVTTAAYQGLVITAVATGGQTVANLAAGQTNFGQIVVTNGATAITADQFAEGTLDVIVGGAAADTGHYTYKVKGNTAAGIGATFTVFLSEAFRQTTALVAGVDTASLTVSVYSGVNTSAVAAVPVGLTILPVANTATVTYFGWVQTQGTVTVLNDAGGTITVGAAFAQSVTTAGSVVAATASTSPIVGYTRKAITASNAGPAVLNIV